MAKQAGHIKLIGTFDNLCFYRVDGEYFVRMASSLTGKQVKTDKRFLRTMEEASLFGKGSRIGSIVYQSLPKSFRQYWMFKAFTGEAYQWLREGKTIEETIMILWKTYAEVWVYKEEISLSPGAPNTKCTNTKKKKPVPVLKISRELTHEITPPLNKYGIENIVSPVIPLLFSQRMVRRRRNRMECLIA